MQGSRRAPLALRHPARAFWTVAAFTLLADQLSKLMVRKSMVPGQSQPVLDGVFHLTFVRNTGAAFGVFPGRQSIFIAVSLGVLLVIGAYWRRSHPAVWPVVLALGLITGGAIGNLIDRVAYGRVTDFFHVVFLDFPVFNIADSGIVIGVGILIAWLLLVPEQPPVSNEVPEPDVSAEHEPT